MCANGLSELTIALMHLKVMRAYIDGILRFGIPPRFYLGSISINRGKDKTLLELMIKEYAEDTMKEMYGSKDEIGDSEDFFPFVQIPFNPPIK